MILTATARYTPRSSAGQFIASRITPAVRAGVEAFGSLVVEEAQAICPVLTGDLRDSIKYVIIVTGKTITALIWAGMSYAGYVEFGTGRAGASSPGAGPYPYNPNWPGMVAQPFMRPALDTAREAGKVVFASQISAEFKT